MISVYVRNTSATKIVDPFKKDKIIFNLIQIYLVSLHEIRFNHF
ncbi:hypothetical protein CCAND95_200049 [Capnocytophaga canis]|nr:hypothetical protein CCAND95_200049 [Capnocytophaga canis]